MIRLVRLFFAFRGANPWMVVVCLLFASIAQGFGIASLVPLISMVGDDKSHTSSLAGRTVVDVLASVGLSPSLEVLLAVVVIAVAVKAALTVLAMVYVARAVANVGNTLREDLINALLKARWSYFTSKPTGTLVNGVGLESTMSGILYLMISRYISNAIQTLINVAVAFAVSWQLASISIVVGGVVVLSMHSFVRMADKAGRRNIKRSRELVTRLSDAIIGIKPLKAMAREDEFAKLFHRKIEQIRTAVRWEMISKNLLNNLQEPLLMIMMAAGFYILITYGQMPIATVVVMGVLLQRTVQTLGRVQAQYQEAIAAESAYRSVQSMTEEAESAREPVFGARIPSLDVGCTFRNVSFSFGDVRIINNLNLRIPARKLTLIVGASGTGKTTLTDLLLGFYKPDRGEILIDGTPLGEIELRAWRRVIGYVPQELILLHDTILANITLGDPSIGEARALEALHLAGAGDFVARLPDGLATEVGEKGARFSGGQRQRIALARAIVHQPKLLILDEVTSALDSETELEICENIKRISRSMTVLAISHRQAWIDIADEVILLEGQDSEPVLAS